NYPSTPDLYTLSLHDALPICFIGNILADSFNNTGTELLAPSYRTPYSMQFNIGVQRELRPGTVLTVDYLRNIGLHSLLGYDTNQDRKSTRLNSSHVAISYAVF